MTFRVGRSASPLQRSLVLRCRRRPHPARHPGRRHDPGTGSAVTLLRPPARRSWPRIPARRRRVASRPDARLRLRRPGRSVLCCWAGRRGFGSHSSWHAPSMARPISALVRGDRRGSDHRCCRRLVLHVRPSYQRAVVLTWRRRRSRGWSARRRRVLRPPCAHRASQTSGPIARRRAASAPSLSERYYLDRRSRPTRRPLGPAPSTSSRHRRLPTVIAPRAACTQRTSPRVCTPPPGSPGTRPVAARLNEGATAALVEASHRASRGLRGKLITVHCAPFRSSDEGRPKSPSHDPIRWSKVSPLLLG